MMILCFRLCHCCRHADARFSLCHCLLRYALLPYAVISPPRYFAALSMLLCYDFDAAARFLLSICCGAMIRLLALMPLR